MGYSQNLKYFNVFSNTITLKSKDFLQKSFFFSREIILNLDFVSFFLWKGMNMRVHNINRICPCVTK
jgi:hypothetical protein